MLPPESPPSPCPCQSGERFRDCCEPFLSGLAQPATALQLMRSRYTAYTRKDVDYLLATYHPNSQEPGLARAIGETADSTHWIGLQIIETTGGEMDDKKGSVTFRATYAQGGRIGEHVERSRFARHQGRWRYVDGEVSS